jgi:hypothetical protein
VAAWLLAAVLRWKEPKAGGGGAATTSSIKLAGYSPDLGDFALFPPLSGHLGDEDWEGISGEFVVVRSADANPGADLVCAHHAVTKIVAVFFGQDGGQSSTSSKTEALMVGRWSSTPTGSQVVHSRLSGGSQGLDLGPGQGRSGTSRSELGRDAWSSPAVVGRGLPGLDCFFYSLFRVVFVKWKVPSSNCRFLWTRDVKGLFCKMYLPFGFI